MSVIDKVKGLDDWVAKQYTKISEKFGLKGKTKYRICLGLDLASVPLCVSGGQMLIGKAADMTIYLSLIVPDLVYNVGGISGRTGDDDTSDSVIVESDAFIYKAHNKYCRLPALLAGVGLVGRFGADVANFVLTGDPIADESFYKPF